MKMMNIMNENKKQKERRQQLFHWFLVPRTEKYNSTFLLILQKLQNKAI